MKGGTVFRNDDHQWFTREPTDEYSRREAELLNMLDIPAHVTNAINVWNGHMDTAAYVELDRDPDAVLTHNAIIHINFLFLEIIRGRINALAHHNPRLIRQNSHDINDQRMFIQQELRHIATEIEQFEPTDELLRDRDYFMTDLDAIQNYNGHITYLLIIFSAYNRFLARYPLYEELGNIHTILNLDFQSRRIRRLQDILYERQQRRALEEQRQQEQQRVLREQRQQRQRERQASRIERDLPPHERSRNIMNESRRSESKTNRRNEISRRRGPDGGRRKRSRKFTVKKK